MNAGSKSSSASAYFLPLDRVVRALAMLREGKGGAGVKWEEPKIPRGTLQVGCYVSHLILLYMSMSLMHIIACFSK